MKRQPAQMNLMKLIEEFDTDSECRSIMEKLRWPKGVQCPRCDSGTVYRADPRRQFDCKSCGYQFSVTSGTIFHDSHLPLPKWFVAVYLMCESKKGISALQMKRTLGVAYKTAWYLCHRIRAAMGDGQSEPLSGVVEVDETWIGGKRQNVGHGYRGNKVIVAGAIQRDGDTRLQLISNADRKTLHGFIRSNTSPDTEVIMTDEWPAYLGIADGDTRHETVNHRAEEWVRGDVHTNGIENAWSLLKRSIVGSYHKVSVKHLDAYLDELGWRFNNRKNQYLFRDTLFRLLTVESLPYEELTSQ